MHRTSVKRATAGLAALAISGAALVAMAPAANADPVNAVSITPATAKTIVAGTSADPAANLTVKAGAMAIGDTLTIEVQPGTGDCDKTPAVNNQIGFADDASVAGGSFTKSLTKSANCDLNNQLTLTATAAVAVNTDLTISSIEYTSSAAVKTGAVRVGATGVAANTGDANAIVAKTSRIGGANRYATAADLAKASAANGCADTAVIVNGINFPDALAASFLGKPILLVQPNALPTETEAAIKSMGIANVIVVGGINSVNESVVDAIKAIDEQTCNAVPGVGKIEAKRISGSDRYQTARAVVMSADAPAVGQFDNGLAGACDPVKTAILVSGQNFPDALAAGALAAGGGKGGTGCGTGALPLLLTPADTLSDAAIEALEFRDIKQVIIVGGLNSVSKAIFDKLDGGTVADVDNVERVSGANRHETAAKLAEDVLLSNTLGNFTGGYVIAQGSNFPDALAGGPVAGAAGQVVLLAESASALGNQAAGVIDDDDSLVALLLGGTNSLNTSVETQTGSAFRGR